MEMRAKKTPCFLKSTAASANRGLHSSKHRRSLAFSDRVAVKINRAIYCVRKGGEPSERAHLRLLCHHL